MQYIITIESPTSFNSRGRNSIESYIKKDFPKDELIFNYKTGKRYNVLVEDVSNWGYFNYIQGVASMMD